MNREAISEYEEALRLKPNLAGPHLNLAAIYLKGKEKAKAVYHLKRYLQLDPNSPQASTMRMKLSDLEQGKY
jgi:predicted Zn-dependent protease